MGVRRLLDWRRLPDLPRPPRNLLAGLVVAVGLGVLVGGVSLVSVPAAFILAGVLVVAAGLLAVDVDALRGKPPR